MRRSATRWALLLSTCLLLSVSMMVGSTIAWFTDSVTSSQNQITAGNLDVELYYQRQGEDDWTEVKEDTKIFKDNALWEPGYTEVIRLKVKNAGTLALKYRLGVNVVEEIGSKNVLGDGFMLSDYIKCGLVDGAATYNRDQAIAAVDQNAGLLGAFHHASAIGLEAGEEKVVTMVVYMPTSVGNEANYAKGEAVPTITLGAKLEATQLDFESDSFDSSYDAEAEFPGGANLLNVQNITVKLPENAPAGRYKLEVTNYTWTKARAGEESKLSCDISLTRDGQKVEAQPGVKYPVEIDLGYALDIQKVTHNGTEITDDEYKYNPLGDKLTFETDSFSPFEIDYVLMGEGVKVEDGKLTAGAFLAGYDPAADMDPALKEENSAYIAVGYTLDGKDYFAVGKRGNTLVLSPDDTEYTPKYTNYEHSITKNASGKLWTLIKGLENNDHSTVVLLPGTYNEGTTIYVTSSMDIIGLGAKDSVKVIKKSSSSSNRHLFNANGSKADYIEVSLRNLYLDATAKTTNNKDNAAVQSIRKSKVKCHDLTIVKGTGWDAIAFYVNGSNDVNGEYYPAYLYAENCSLNTTRSFGVVTTSGKYKFFHSGLTYGGTEYTNNSGSIQKKAMETNDWEWD